MKGDFRQFIVTKVVSHMTVFLILMLLGIGSPATSATEETGEIEVIPIPGLLHINFRKRVDGTKVDDARIDDFLAKYGFIYLPKQCKDYQYKDCILLPSKYKSASKRSRWRKISVEPGTESAWIQFLKSSRLVKKVRQETYEIQRSANNAQRTLDLSKRVQAVSHLTTVTFWKENVFKEVEGFLKQRYGCVMESDFSDKKRCGIAEKGNCCIEIENTFPRYRHLSISYLNKEVIKYKDLFESLEIKLFIDEETNRFLTIINGKYALKRWEGKQVPPVEQKDMEANYPQDLNKFVTHFAENLKIHLEKGGTE
jgi:hypothetical protein